MAALANEKGGRLVFGMADKRPHEIVGTSYEMGNLGALADAIYKYHGIRVDIKEYFDEDKRVVVFNIPSRPIGKMLKFEGVPLMRIGESLREMSDDEMRKILNEQEPDFSAKICEGLNIDDLDEEAINVMKIKYAEKQKNPSFKQLPTEQVLTDLELLENGRLNYAALMLLGKKEIIHRLLPQYEVVVEYRKNKASITYTARKEFVHPLFVGVYKVWEFLNQPLSNPMEHVRVGLDMHDILAFNEDSVREAILNSLTHRSMQIQSSVFIKQSPEELTIVNPGGFPIGVTLDNILTVSSTPRQKRLAEVLQKTGLVERSGQGIDKMFANCIMDGKQMPSFDGTDNYQVSLTFFSKLRYPKLVKLVRMQQEIRSDDNPLVIFDLMGLYFVNRGEEEKVPETVMNHLKEEKLIAEIDGNWNINGGNDTANDDANSGKNDPLNDPLNDNGQCADNQLTKRQKSVAKYIEENTFISRKELSKKLKVSEATIKREIKILGYRWEGHSTNGHWVKNNG